MVLKWVGILVAVVAVTLLGTANLTNDGHVPTFVNVVALVIAAVAVLVAIVGDLYVRIDTKLERLRTLVNDRLDRLDAETGDRNAGFVEGYLLSRGADGSVVPMAPRGRRSAGAADD